jgi:pyridoxal phosphate enzyme (YggS family)
MTHIPAIENLDRVKHQIEHAALAAGREPQSIRLLAVSKTRSAEEVRSLFDAGLDCFGENRVQELLEKSEELPAAIEWHLIGHLQKNKVRQAVRAATWIHSVDSVQLLERISKIAEEENIRPKILLQINVSGEKSKFGLPPEKATPALKTALELPNVDVRGLMTMAPFDADDATLHTIFCELRKLRDTLQSRFHTPLPELSMGMSSDYHIAITEGATIVRIGTALFGARQRT